MDPISGQMASQAVESLANQNQIQGPSGSESGVNFDDVMSAGSDGVGAVDGVEAVQSAEAIEQVDSAESIEQIDEIPTEDFIQSLLRDEAGIEEMMERCMSGAKLEQDEMLQMQALIYSYSQRVDLTTKVVDKATSGVQQVMNTQV